MLKQHRDRNLFAIVAFSAAVAAPIAEEFLFRVLLQGWLEKAFTFHGPTSELVLGAPPAEPTEEAQADVLAPRPRGYRALAPIAISALIFALLHWSHGPDWVPLSVLAIGLGYLYQRTHRIVPSLTVHALLNGFTVLILWFELFARPAKL
jgi:membrane protease YdiL (CAAX protease family)